MAVILAQYPSVGGTGGVPMVSIYVTFKKLSGACFIVTYFTFHIYMSELGTLISNNETSLVAVKFHFIIR